MRIVFRYTNIKRNLAFGRRELGGTFAAFIEAYTSPAPQLVETRLMQSMSTFDPDHACVVHDGLNGYWLQWDPERDAEHYRQHAENWDPPNVISWDGLLLDGWMDTEQA